MKKIKSTICTLIALSMIATLAACGATAPAASSAAPASSEAASASSEAPASSAPASSEAASEAPAGDGSAIKLWFWDNSVEANYKTIIADFEAKNPGMKVEMSILPWGDYWTKIQTALPTGEGPDLFWLNHPNAVTYVPSGNLMDLTDKGLDMSHFSKNLSDPFSKDGKLYGVPAFFDTVVMFYNKSLFDAAGVAYPAKDWTWNDMREMAKKLTKADGAEISQYGLAVSPEGQGGTFNFILQNNGRLFSADHMKSEVNNPEAVEAIQFLLDMQHKDKTTLAGTEFMQNNLMGELFINNMVAMEVSGMWRVAPYKDALGDKLGICHMAKGKVESGIFHDVAYAAAAKSKNPDATVAFLKYATTKEHSDALATVFLPAYDQSQDAWYATFPGLDVKVFSEAITYSQPLQIAAKNAGAVYGLYNTEMEKVFANPEVGDSLAKIDETLNAEINK